MVISSKRKSIAADTVEARMRDVKGPVESHEPHGRDHVFGCITKLLTMLAEMIIPTSCWLGLVIYKG